MNLTWVCVHSYKWCGDNKKNYHDRKGTNHADLKVDSEKKFLKYNYKCICVYKIKKYYEILILLMT